MPIPRAPHVARGERIPGSRYFRGYCCRCKEPIRVATPGACKDDLATCEECLGFDGAHMILAVQLYSSRNETSKRGLRIVPPQWLLTGRVS